MSEPGSAGGFSGQEVFTPTDARSKAVSQMISMGCLLIVLGVLMFFLLGALWGALHLPGGAPAAGAIVVLALIGLAAWRYSSLKQSFARTSLTVSPYGVVVNDGAATSTLAWHDMQEVHKILPWRPVGTRPVAGTAISKGATQALTEGTRSLLGGIGIVGPGQIEINPETGMALRHGIENDRAEQFGFDAQSGQPRVGVAPSVVLPADAPWTRTRFGEWLRHFRPDIWEVADAELDKYFRHTRADQGRPDDPNQQPPKPQA